MSWYRIYFGSEKSIGVEVEAISEKEAKIAAMTILKENRGGGSWSPRQCVDWEHGKSSQIPPTVKDFGRFPRIVKVVQL